MICLLDCARYPQQVSHALQSQQKRERQYGCMLLMLRSSTVSSPSISTSLQSGAVRLEHPAARMTPSVIIATCSFVLNTDRSILRFSELSRYRFAASKSLSSCAHIP